MSKKPTPTGPTLIGIGAQKCASSWLHAVLGVHPEIGISGPKELDFFSYYFDRGALWYYQFFAPLATKPVRAEVSPSYFHDPRAPERARAFNPDLQIVAVLRDPIERAFSNHLHEIIKGHIPVCSFADGWRNNPAYLEQSLYARHLSRWFDTFPRTQIHVILSDDIRTNPQAVADVLYRFAGVMPPPPSPVICERRNVSDLARWPWLRHVLRRGGAGLRALGLENELAHFKSLPPVARLLSANSHDLRNMVPEMDAGTRARFQDAVADDIAALSRLLNRPSLSWSSWHGEPQ